MNVLAIDPGSRAFGVSYFEDGTLIFSDEVMLNDKLPIEQRYNSIVAVFSEILCIIKTNVDVCAVEMPFVRMNPSVTVKLGTVRGIFIGMTLAKFPSAEIMDIQTFTIRRTLGLGKGASKDDMHSAIQEFIRKEQGAGEDSLDSIAIGVTAYKTYGIKKPKIQAKRPRRNGSVGRKATSE